MARVDKIKESWDGSQRVVVVTYTNIGINKKGNWIGTPVSVDLVLVDAALDDSTLSPEVNTAAEEDLPEIEDSGNPVEPENSSAQVTNEIIEVMNKDEAKPEVSLSFGFRPWFVRTIGNQSTG